MTCCACLGHLRGHLRASGGAESSGMGCELVARRYFIATLGHRQMA